MKTITITNGEIRKGYEFGDLSTEAQDKVLNEQVDFEITVMNEESPYYHIAQEMERMKTPWFLASEIFHKHKKDLIENIEINDYLFDESGEMLPIMRYMKGNKEVKTTFGKKEYLCTIK